jgi:hypothetical protein
MNGGLVDTLLINVFLAILSVVCSHC